MTSPVWDRHPELLSIALVAAVFSVDLLLPLGVASAVPYTFAVLLALRSPRLDFVVGLAITCGLLTFLKMVLLPDRGTTELWKVVANRFLALFSISMTLMLGLLRRRAESHRRMVEGQLREHQASLAQLGRLSLLGQVTANMAHELNQPLAAASLQAELAKRQAEQTAADPTLLGHLQEVVRQTHRAADIVKGVRRLAKQSAQRHELLDLAELIQTVIALFDWQFRRSQVHLQVDLPKPTLPAVSGDRVLIEQVLVNLLQNALDALATQPPPRDIIVRVVPQPGRIVLYVLDNGPGLVDTVQIFEPFFTTKPEGLGLGLPFCRNIVDVHGGRMWANARRTGGTEIGLWLPIPDPEPREDP